MIFRLKYCINDYIPLSEIIRRRLAAMAASITVYTITAINNSVKWVLHPTIHNVNWSRFLRNLQLSLFFVEKVSPIT